MNKKKERKEPKKEEKHLPLYEFLRFATDVGKIHKENLGYINRKYPEAILQALEYLRRKQYKAYLPPKHAQEIEKRHEEVENVLIPVSKAYDALYSHFIMRKTANIRMNVLSARMKEKILKYLEDIRYRTHDDTFTYFRTLKDYRFVLHQILDDLEHVISYLGGKKRKKEV